MAVAAAEETGVAVVEESGEETDEIRMKFSARSHGIDREGQKAVAERKIGDGGGVGADVEGRNALSGAPERQRQRRVDVSI